MKTIVITGATGATGRLAAKAFAERGHRLALLSKSQSKLDSLARDLALPEGRLHVQTVDLLHGSAAREAAQAVVSKFGGVHALIHLVGGWTGGQTIPDSSADDLEAMLAQHVRSAFHALQAFVPHIAAGGWGRVMAVSSPLAVKPAAKMSLYAAAKAAQENLILSLAEEYRESGLTANVIQVKSIDLEGKGRGTPPAEIVAAMMYLFSDEAAKINGARLPLY
jgi:NAD(P)-dependent dehydrogenase (short-subunit alcohol dehydrogenase family)